MFLVLTQKLTFQLEGRSYGRGSVFQVAADDPGREPALARPVVPGAGEPLPFRALEVACLSVPVDRAVKCQTWREALTAAGRLG
jgi:hypothetical protein